MAFNRARTRSRFRARQPPPAYQIVAPSATWAPGDGGGEGDGSASGRVRCQRVWEGEHAWAEGALRAACWGRPIEGSLQQVLCWSSPAAHPQQHDGSCTEMHRGHLCVHLRHTVWEGGGSGLTQLEQTAPEQCSSHIVRNILNKTHLSSSEMSLHSQRFEQAHAGTDPLLASSSKAKCFSQYLASSPNGGLFPLGWALCAIGGCARDNPGGRASDYIGPMAVCYVPSFICFACGRNNSVKYSITKLRLRVALAQRAWLSFSPAHVNRAMKTEESDMEAETGLDTENEAAPMRTSTQGGVNGIPRPRRSHRKKGVRRFVSPQERGVAANFQEGPGGLYCVPLRHENGWSMPCEEGKFTSSWDSFRFCGRNMSKNSTVRDHKTA
eukprot:scaffold121014_cov19-Tisochrysis_lutea.AAC.1